MSDFKQLAEFYELQAEAFSLHYEGYVSHLNALIAFAGIITKMESDVIEYELKHGNKKTSEQNERIANLKEVYKDLSSLSTQNEILKMQMRTNNGRMLQLENENEYLKSTLEANEKAWKA